MVHVRRSTGMYVPIDSTFETGTADGTGYSCTCTVVRRPSRLVLNLVCLKSRSG
eukprot:SAG31_NODE_2469_length_5650_cov_2.117636_1_plen_53_part_10